MGSAKSWSLLFKVLQHVQHPGNRGLVGRRHMPELHATLWRDFFDVVPPDWIKRIDRSRHSIEFKNRSIVDFVHLSDPDSAKGHTLGFAAVDEATEVPEDSIRQLRMRLRRPGFDGQLFMGTNPGGRTHWLYRDFVDPATRRPGNSYHRASSLENVFVPAEYHLDLLRSFSGDYAKRFIEGEWIDWEGRVWPSFADESNLLDATTLFIPPDWPRELAIDFGYEHAFACLWIAWDYRVSPPRMVVYDEYVQRERTLLEHARAIYAKTIQHAQPFVGYRSIWADHDAQDRHELANLEQRQLRLVTKPARKARGERRMALAAVEAAFRPRADGVPGILVSSACTVTRDQILGFRRPKKIPADDPDAVIETNDRGESIDDTCDALWMGFWSTMGDRFHSEPNFQPALASSAARSDFFRTFRGER